MPTAARTEVTYAAALDLFEQTLAGDARGRILDALETKGDLTHALARLRAAMRAHVFPTGGAPLDFARIVSTFDRATRAEGFHVLESWDYRAHRFSTDTVPVLMLERCAAADVPAVRRRQALAVLLDQYFLSVLGLLSVRAWDTGDANGNLARVSALVALLNGAAGSGQRWVDDAETLLLLAISHYHPREAAYDGLLERVRRLDDEHALRLATACAATLGGHLRWGHRFMYQRDISRMRADNVVDYPWLQFSLATLARAYAGASGAPGRARLSEALLNGLSADPWAFTGRVPAMLSSVATEHEALRTILHEHRAGLAEDFARHRPAPGAFTPLGVLCNFLCNAIVAMAAVGVVGDDDHPSLNELFTAHRDDAGKASAAQAYARTLMAYATANGGRPDGAALIVYDPYEAQTALNTTLRVVGESARR
jgi:hypothetical protein